MCVVIISQTTATKATLGAMEEYYFSVELKKLFQLIVINVLHVVLKVFNLPSHVKVVTMLTLKRI